jgi:ATP/maltotriose-dependent transcriptional regulator MalT
MVAWYSCTRASIDLARLAVGLADAIEGVTGDSFTSLRERLKVTARPQAEGDLLAEIFLDCVNAEQPRLLVVDDYQFLSDELAAEDFAERVLVDSSVNTLVLSRTQPRWASARRKLYREIGEVDVRELRMTEAEVRRIFAAVGREPSAEELALADGWPAVVGLLALGTSGSRVRGSVDRFLTDEVCRTLGADVVGALAVVGCLRRFGHQLACSVLGDELAKHAVVSASAAGLLTEVDRGVYELHPLVRDHLTAQVPELDIEPYVSRVADHCVSNELWDELFEFADRLESSYLLNRLFECGVRPSLDEGRSETVRTWIDFARSGRFSVDWLPLAEAELALRDGLYLQAETVAVEANETFESPAATAWALGIAGRAAHLGGREEHAARYYKLAQAVATTPSEKRNAEWGELKSRIDLEGPEASALLDRMRSSALLTPTDQVELAARSLLLGARLGNLHSLEIARSVAQLVSLVPDPILRTSFRNIYAYSCAIAGEYDEAASMLDELEADAGQHRLRFVHAYARFARAVVAVGLREFENAFALLGEATAEARRTGDEHVLASCAAIKARALIAMGRFDEAAALASFDHGSLIAAMRAELRVTRALAAALSGETPLAIQLCEEARSMSQTVEVPVIAASVAAICAIRDDALDATTHAEAAATSARESWYVDGFVTAYRGCPELARRVASGAERSWFASVLQRVGDDEIAQVAGLGTRVGPQHLSPREAEVFSLLRLGLTNKEIGRKLFISEGTAKVHVHHILEKLEVHSRTEAVLKAPRLG